MNTNSMTWKVDVFTDVIATSAANYCIPITGILRFLATNDTLYAEAYGAENGGFSISGRSGLATSSLQRTSYQNLQRT